MNDPQGSATKPVFLKSSTPIAASLRPSAALQGATSAFLPKSPSVTTSLSPTTATPTSGARYAALVAGTHSQKFPPPKIPKIVKSHPETSPERGRPANSSTNAVHGAARSVTSSNLGLPPTKPIPIGRSPSAIAARYASRSTSAGRGPGRSPQRTYDKADSGLSTGTSRNTVQALSSGASTLLEPSPTVKQPASTPLGSALPQVELIPALTATPNNDDATARDIGAPVHTTYKIGMVGGTPKQYDPAASAVARPRKMSANGSFMAHSLFRRGSSETSTTAMVSERDTGTSYKHPGFVRARPQIPGRHSHPTKHSSPNSVSPDARFGMTPSSLADAMVGASLASSRAASPAKKPVLSHARRRSRSVSALHDLLASYELEESRKPAKPLKTLKGLKHTRPMKHTLRKPSASDDEEPAVTKRGRRHWMRKHPNMHHEGDRKRWRDKVTEPERRRYEGVFAANRGLFIGPGYFQPSYVSSDLWAEGNRVANVVVRELWERSRLPHEILREVYDLVSPEEEHALQRDQFVVGMWLVDQRLKGRKLPVKVSPSVWGSVRHPDGIKLRK